MPESRESCDLLMPRSDMRMSSFSVMVMMIYPARSIPALAGTPLRCVCKAIIPNVSRKGKHFLPYSVGNLQFCSNFVQIWVRNYEHHNIWCIGTIVYTRAKTEARFHAWKADLPIRIVNNVVQAISSFATRLIFTGGNDMVTKNGG